MELLDEVKADLKAKEESKELTKSMEKLQQEVSEIKKELKEIKEIVKLIPKEVKKQVEEALQPEPETAAEETIKCSNCGSEVPKNKLVHKPEEDFDEEGYYCPKCDEMILDREGKKPKGLIETLFGDEGEKKEKPKKRK